jgi:hypothetical protein
MSSAGFPNPADANFVAEREGHQVLLAVENQR